MKGKIAYGVTAIVSIGLCLALLLGRPASHGVVNGQSIAPTGILPTNAQMRSNAEPPHQQLNAANKKLTQITLLPLSRNTTLSEQYARASDLKLILDQAKLHPEKGSYFYAAMALRECEQLPLTLFTALIPAGSEDDPKRAMMIERAKKRCANITENDLKGLRKLGSDGLAAGDIGFKAVAPITLKQEYYDSTREIEKRLATIEALYESKDAGITELAIREIMISSDSIVINQRTLGEIERSSLPAALLLLSCDLGAACDTANALVQLECVGRGRCDFTSVDDYAQRVAPENWAGWTRATRYDYQTAVRLKNEIAAAIARGDRSAFFVDTSSKR